MPQTPAETKYLQLAHQIIESEQTPPCEDNPTVFYPDGFEYLTKTLYAEAKAICSGCPFKKACLDYALTAEEQYGVWGGLTPEERHILVKAHRQSTAPSSRQRPNNNPI